MGSELWLLGPCTITRIHSDVPPRGSPSWVTPRALWLGLSPWLLPLILPHCGCFGHGAPLASVLLFIEPFPTLFLKPQIVPRTLIFVMDSDTPIKAYLKYASLSMISEM